MGKRTPALLSTMGSVCIIYYNVWPGILQQTIYVGRPVLGNPTTSRTQLGTHKELAEHAWGTYKELLPVTQGIETLWLATCRMRGEGGQVDQAQLLFNQSSFT